MYVKTAIRHDDAADLLRRSARQVTGGAFAGMTIVSGRFREAGEPPDGYGTPYAVHLDEALRLIDGEQTAIAETIGTYNDHGPGAHRYEPWRGFDDPVTGQRVGRSVLATLPDGTSYEFECVNP